MSEMKTFLPEQWENAPSNSNAAKNAPQQMTPYNNGGECTYDKVNRVIGLIEESGVDITEGYDAWVKVGFALASEFKESGRDFFHRVSKVNAKYNHAETDKQLLVSAKSLMSINYLPQRLFIGIAEDNLCSLDF